LVITALVTFVGGPGYSITVELLDSAVLVPVVVLVVVEDGRIVVSVVVVVVVVVFGSSIEVVEGGRLFTS